jgi:hypothetical protein
MRQIDDESDIVRKSMASLGMTRILPQTGEDLASRTAPH